MSYSPKTLTLPDIGEHQTDPLECTNNGRSAISEKKRRLSPRQAPFHHPINSIYCFLNSFSMASLAGFTYISLSFGFSILPAGFLGMVVYTIFSGHLYLARP